MGVLLCTIGSAGEIHPSIGIGRALRARGHAATLVTNAAFEAPGSREDYARARQDPALWHPTRRFGAIATRIILPTIEPRYNPIARHDPGAPRASPSATTVCADRRVSPCSGVSGQRWPRRSNR